MTTPPPPSARAAAIVSLLLALGLAATGCAKKIILSSPGDEPEARSETPPARHDLPTAEEFASGRPRPAPVKTAVPETSAPGAATLEPAVPARRTAEAPAPPYQEEGQAGRYGDEAQGAVLAGGQTYDREALTAAHRILPLGVRVEVVNLENGRIVTVVINDRGPFKDADRRIIDLSQGAAERLGMLMDRPAPVRIKVLDPLPGDGAGGLAGEFSVQVGSYTILSNAEKVLADLKERGYTGSRIVGADTGGKTFHRVRAGTFHGLSAALMALEQLRLAYPGSLVLRD